MTGSIGRLVAHIGFLIVFLAIICRISATTFVVPCCSTTDIQTALSNPSYDTVTLTANMIYSGPCDLHFDHPGVNATLQGNGATIQCTSGTYGFIIDDPMSESTVKGPLTMNGTSTIAVNLENGYGKLSNMKVYRMLGGLRVRYSQVVVSNSVFASTVLLSQQGTVGDVIGGSVVFDNVTTRDNSESSTLYVQYPVFKFQDATLTLYNSYFDEPLGQFITSPAFVQADLIISNVTMDLDGSRAPFYLESTGSLIWSGVTITLQNPGSGVTPIYFIASAGSFERVHISWIGATQLMVTSVSAKITHSTFVIAGSLISGPFIDIAFTTINVTSQLDTGVFSGGSIVTMTGMVLSGMQLIAGINSLTAVNSTFENNFGAIVNGPTMAVLYLGSIKLVGCTFRNNLMPLNVDDPAGDSAIIVFNNYGLQPFDIQNCSFVRNIATRIMKFYTLRPASQLCGYIGNSFFLGNVALYLVDIAPVSGYGISSQPAVYQFSNVHFANNQAVRGISMSTSIAADPNSGGPNACWAGIGPDLRGCETKPTILGQTTLQLDDVTVVGDVYLVPSIGDAGFAKVVDQCTIFSFNPFDVGRINATNLLVHHVTATTYLLSSSYGNIENMTVVNANTTTIADVFMLVMARSWITDSIFARFNHVVLPRSSQYDITCRQAPQIVLFDEVLIQRCQFSGAINIGPNLVSALNNVTFLGNSPHPTIFCYACGSTSFAGYETTLFEPGGGVLIVSCLSPPITTASIVYNGMRFSGNVANESLLVLYNQAVFSNSEFVNNTVVGSNSGLITIPNPLYGQCPVAVVFTNVAVVDSKVEGIIMRIASTVSQIQFTNVLIGNVITAPDVAMIYAPGTVLTWTNVTVSDYQMRMPPVITGAILGGIVGLQLRNLANTSFIMRVQAQVNFAIITISAISIFNVTSDNIMLEISGQGVHLTGLNILHATGQALSVASTRAVTWSFVTLLDSTNPTGPVVVVTNAATITVHDVVLARNDGDLSEDGYFALSGTAKLTNFLVYDNVGPLIFPASISLAHATFRNNTSARGALLVHAGAIKQALFERHITSVGALNVAYFKGTVDIANSTFRDNTCDGFGAAIHVEAQNTLKLTNVSLTSNSATEGGAIFVDAGGIVAFAFVSASDNIAEIAGGAVRMVESVGSIQDSTFVGNQVTSLDASQAMGGGALYAELGLGAITLTGVTMRANLAVFGGGARVDGPVSFSNSSIISNTAFRNGGGLYLGPKTSVGNPDPVLSTSLILSGNIADLGAGLYCQGCGVHLNLSSVQLNTASTNGGGYYCDLQYTGYQIVDLEGQNTINSNAGNGTQTVCGTCGCCQLPLTIANVSADCVIAPGRTCDFTCKPGYDRHGDAAHGGLLYCNETSSLLSTTACDAIRCQDPPEVAINGGYDFIPNAMTPNITHLNCNPGFVPILQHDPSLVPTGTIQCIGPNWTRSEPDFACQLVTCATTVGPFASNNTNCPATLYFGFTCTNRCGAGTEGVNADITCKAGGTNRTLGQLSFVSNGLDCSKQCDNGYYRNNTEETGSCQYCGAHMLTLSIGSTSFMDCGCVQGYFINDTICSPCPKGADCAGFRAPPVSKPGYFPSNDTDDKVIYLECRPAIACAGNNSCALGYEGYLCGDCSPDFHRFSGKCLSCPAVNGWRVTLGIIGGLIACLLLMFATKPTQESERTVGFGSLTVGISFIQLVATFATINVAWPKSSSNMYDTFSTANLNVEIVNPECSVKANFYDKFQTTLLMPFAIFALFCLAWVIGSLFIWLKAKRPKLAAIRLRLEQLAEAALSGFYFFLSLAYLLLARASFSIFACPRQADGRRTLTDNPAEECSGPVWSRNAVFGVFGIIVYVFGSPFLLHISYHLVNRKFGSRVAGNTYISNFLVKAYRPKFWFWEVVSMARKLAIVIIALYAVQDPTIQVVLSCAVFFVSAVLTLVFKPFEWPKHNFIEVVTQLGCIIVLFCGAVAANRNVDNKLSATESTALDVVIITTTVLVIICVVVCFLFEVGITVYIGKVFKKLYPKKPPPHVTVADTRQQVAFICDNSHAVLSVAADGSICHRNETTLVAQADYPVSGLLNPVTHAAAMGDFVVLAAGNQLTVQHTTGVEVWSIKELPANVTSLASNQYGLALGLADGHVMLWRKSSSISQTPVVPMSGVEAMEEIKASKDVTQEGLVGYQALKPLEVASGWVIGVAFELDFVYTLDARFVKKWNAQSGVCLRKWEMLELPDVTCLAVKGSSIAVGGGNGRVVLILEEGDSREVLAGHRAAISSLAIAKDYIISGSLDGKINCWDLNTGRYRQCMPDNSDRVTLVATDPTGSRVFWALRSGEIHSYPLHADWDRVNVEFLLWKSQKQNCKRCKIPRVLFGGEGFDRDGDVLQSFTTASDGSKPGVYDELELLVQGTKWDELDIEDANHIASLLGNAVDRSKAKHDTQL